MPTEVLNSTNQSNAQTASFDGCYAFTASYFEVENTELQIANSVVNLLLMIATIIGNFLVLFSIARTPSLHQSPSNILIISLALSDFGSGFIAQPICAVFMFAKLKGDLPTLCISGLLVYISGYFLAFASMLTIASISLDRYVALYLHLRYHSVVTVRRTIVLLAGIWTVSLLGGLTWAFNPRISFPIAAVVISLAITVTTIAYFQIYRIILTHRAQIHAQLGQVDAQAERDVNFRKQAKSATSMLVVYCILLLCYLPYQCTAFVTAVTSHTASKQSVFEVATNFVFLNASLNPIIYCWRMRHIRRAVLQTIRMCK